MTWEEAMLAMDEALSQGGFRIQVEQWRMAGRKIGEPQVNICVFAGLGVGGRFYTGRNLTATVAAAIAGEESIAAPADAPTPRPSEIEAEPRLINGPDELSQATRESIEKDAAEILAEREMPF